MGPCTSVRGMNRSPHDIDLVNRLLAPAGSSLRGCWRRGNISPTTSTKPPCGSFLASKALHRPEPPGRRSTQPFRTCCSRRRALGLGATLTTLYLQFEKEAEAALGLPPGVHSYALLPIGYPMGRFGLVRRVPLADIVLRGSVGPALPRCVARRSAWIDCPVPAFSDHARSTPDQIADPLYCWREARATA